ncbi:MAG: hypothetical protein JW942_07180, partial [Opitutales bacterium]|nr:hypothetical protein [Opitutales bacterium]
MDRTLYQDLPDLSNGVLAELGGWAVLREARAIFESGAVKSVEWEKPVLSAELQIGGQQIRTRLSLRSMAFAENRCNCERGRRGYVCSHALAACLAIVSEKAKAEKEARQSSTVNQRQVPKSKALATKPAEIKAVPTALRSFNVDSSGSPMYCRMVLPPNLKTAAPRNMIMLKLELLTQGRRTPPERIFKGSSYKLDAQTLKALLLVERWTSDKLAGILQLKREQLHELVRILVGTPCFEWAGKPDEAMKWDGESLVGVSELVAPAPPATDEPKAAHEDNAPDCQAPRISVRRSSGVMTSRAPSSLDLRPMPPPRELVRRREMEEESKVVVDGSPHFLSMR